jgi:hypothetical protein
MNAYTGGNEMGTAEILATIGTILGYFLVTEGVLGFGFAISALAQIAWIVWALSGQSKAWGIVIVNCCLLVASINGLMGVL